MKSTKSKKPGLTSSHILLAAVLTLLGSPCAAIAASPRAPLSPSSGTLSSYLVTAPKAAVLNRLAAQFEIENKSGTVYEIIVPSEKTAELLRIAPSASLLEPDLGAAARARFQKFRARQPFLAGYHSFDEVITLMKKISSDHPELAQISQYGTSQGGKSLMALRVTSKKTTSKPVIMLTSATHGDELITVEVVMNLIQQLVNGYGSNARLTGILDHHDIYFIPVVNPDGFSNQDRYDNGTDPNRSYPYPENPNATPSASIAGVIKFYQSHHVAASIDFHAYGKLIMYPWAYTDKSIPPASQATFDSLTSKMAASNNYTYGQISKVIYVAKGSSADYYYWKGNTFALGIEMGDEKIPDASAISDYVHQNEESTWRFIEGF